MPANPQMISLVRAVRRLTQKQLAEATSIRQSYVSMIEAGARVASDETVVALADALDCPVALLESDAPIKGGEAQDLHFRRRKTLSVADRARLEGKLHLAYLTVRGLLRGVDYEPSVVLPQLSLEDIASPTEAARHVRRLWRIPTGPIRNLTDYLEAAGLFLVPCNAPGKVDAVTRRCEHGWHVTAYNRGMPPDRDRLTRAHELAHLVLHYSYFGPDVEAEADEFAAELLTPADEIGPQLTGLTTRDLWKLTDLRLHWKVSVPFLVQRAYELDCISDRQRRSFYQALSSRGMMHRTIDDQLPTETPTLLRRVISVHLNDHGYSLDSLASVSLMTTDRFQRHFSTAPSGHPKLSVVKS